MFGLATFLRWSYTWMQDVKGNKLIRYNTLLQPIMLVQTRSQIYKQTRHEVVFGLVKFAFSQSQGDLKTKLFDVCVTGVKVTPKSVEESA